MGYFQLMNSQHGVSLGMTICTEPVGTRTEPLLFPEPWLVFFTVGQDMVESKG